MRLSNSSVYAANWSARTREPATNAPDTHGNVIVGICDWCLTPAAITRARAETFTTKHEAASGMHISGVPPKGRTPNTARPPGPHTRASSKNSTQGQLPRRIRGHRACAVADPRNESTQTGAMAREHMTVAQPLGVSPGWPEPRDTAGEARAEALRARHGLRRGHARDQHDGRDAPVRLDRRALAGDDAAPGARHQPRRHPREPAAGGGRLQRAARATLNARYHRHGQDADRGDADHARHDAPLRRAGGERPELVARLRNRTAREVCNRDRLAALRAGYRFVYSHADVVGGEIRIVIGPADCSGVQVSPAARRAPPPPPPASPAARTVRRSASARPPPAPCRAAR